MNPTVDPDVFITKEELDRIEYENIRTGEKWAVLGTCNRCGLCEIGCVDNRVIWSEVIAPGYPNACIDKEFYTRKDVPMHPNADQDMKDMAKLYNDAPGCTLTYKWIDRGD